MVSGGGAERGRARVVLVRPPVIMDPAALATHGPVPPLGVAYLAAAVREAGHDVHVVDAAGEALDRIEAMPTPIGVLHRVGLALDEIVARVPDDPTLIGISSMFVHEWPTVRDLAARLRQRFPEVPIVLGGENPTAFHATIFEQSAAVDACVLGEGERTLLAVVDRLQAGGSLAGLPGVAARAAEAVVDGGLSVRLSKKELAASIPWPAWDLVPLDRYWAHYPFIGVHRGRSMQMLGTRGCPYKCTFCSSPQMWTTKYVVREPADVVDEICHYVERYGVSNINFVDLTAATNRRWTLGLCDELEARAPGVTWQLPVGTRIEAIDREVLERLAATGCRNVTFAPESGSQRMLEVMDKRVSLDHVLEAVVDARDLGIRTSINIIIGHPAERWRDVLQSIRYLLRAAWLGCSDCGVMMFAPYPGSADFDALVASGRLHVDDAACYVGLSRSSSHHTSFNPTLSARTLHLLQLVMVASFYATSWLRRPVRAVRFLRALVTGREDTYLDQMLRSRMKRLAPVDGVEAPVLVAAER